MRPAAVGTDAGPVPEGVVGAAGAGVALVLDGHDHVEGLAGRRRRRVGGQARHHQVGLAHFGGDVQRPGDIVVLVGLGHRAGVVGLGVEGVRFGRAIRRVVECHRPRGAGRQRVGHLFELQAVRVAAADRRVILEDGGGERARAPFALVLDHRDHVEFLVEARRGRGRGQALDDQVGGDRRAGHVEADRPGDVVVVVGLEHLAAVVGLGVDFVCPLVGEAERVGHGVRGRHARGQRRHMHAGPAACVAGCRQRAGIQVDAGVGGPGVVCALVLDRHDHVERLVWPRGGGLYLEALHDQVRRLRRLPPAHEDVRRAVGVAGHQVGGVRLEGDRCPVRG